MTGSGTPTRPRVAITAGDPNGIGPEVALKCVADPDIRGLLDPVLVGSRGVLRVHAETLGIQGIPCPVVDPLPGERHDVRYGEITPSGGRLAMSAVARAVTMCLAGEVDAMVTAPISKEAIALAGYGEPGHTEFIARHCDAAEYLMMMVDEGFRVGLVTSHVAVRDIAQGITQEAIQKRLGLLARSLTRDFGIDSPRIAVLGLNPHAGDGGVMGTEEMEIIRPAMKATLPDSCFGPYPADGFFGRKAWTEFDAVLAMYHDQGLVPFKTVAFDSGVNFTAGLPIVRTSPDHGTAYDIAGAGIARPDSMLSAARLAVEIVATRNAQLGVGA